MNHDDERDFDEENAVRRDLEAEYAAEQEPMYAAAPEPTIGERMANLMDLLSEAMSVTDYETVCEALQAVIDDAADEARRIEEIRRTSGLVL
jgi:hypothetical protein